MRVPTTGSAIDSTIERILLVAERARTRGPLPSVDAEFVRRTVPSVLGSIHDLRPRKALRHPAGFAVNGAPVGTFLRCALLLAGQKVLGRRLAGQPFFEEVERDLALGVMRSHFHHGHPKGTHCCAMCTLAVYPVLRAGAIRYFDCAPLARDVRAIILGHQWRFTRGVSSTAVRWSLGDAPS